MKRKRTYLLSILSAALLLSGLLPLNAGRVEASPARSETSSENRMGQVDLFLRQAGDVPRFEPGDCPEKIQSRVPAGEVIRCGVLVVPARYSDPQGPTIQLGVVIIPAVTQTTAPDPVVFAQGGPGGSTIDTYTQVLFSSRIRGNRDFILFDQRGTLYAKPVLYCQEIFDETVRTLAMDLSTQESEKLFSEAALACRKRLEDDGVDISAYNSVENAKDIESLRQALGLPRINLYGVSYGTLLALHAMREEPQALRSVIIDSVVPTTVDFIFEAPKAQDRAFTEFFNACREDAACNEAYPNLEKTFFDLVDRLNQHPVQLTLTDDETGKSYPTLMNGDAMVGALFQLLYQTELIPLLPKMIHNVTQGRYAFLERIFSLITFDRTMSEGMYLSVVCSEDGIVDPTQYTYDGVRPQLSKDAEMENESTVALCKAWNVEQLGAGADAPVVSDIPTLVFNGRFDPITPPSYGMEAAKTLSKSYVYVFPNTGHGALTSSTCADSIFLEFLSNPEREPDSSCIDAIPAVHFLTNSDVIDLPVMLQLASLQGSFVWQGVMFGLGLLGMLTSLLVFPLLWVIRSFRSLPGKETPGLVNLAAWLPFMNSGVLITLAGALFAVVIIQVTQNETAPLFFGLPAKFGALLTLGFLSLLLTLGMLVFTAAGWAGKYWSAGRKIYYSLLAVSALLTTVVMGIWGLFTFFL
jgi:pimeloyl-ACP methyl ester carboxylesterase